MAHALALHLDARFYYAERQPAAEDDGLFRARYALPAEQSSQARSERFAVVDDAISAGSSARATVAALAEAGATVAVVGTFLLLGEIGAGHFDALGIPIEAVDRRKLALWKPADCPLCGRGALFGGCALNDAIRQAISDADVTAARQLFLEYQAWLGVDLCFQGFATELATLPGDYAPPRGRLLLARAGPAGDVAGCIALRPLDADRCEMKRLFVRLAHHGAGLGRRLIERLVDEARTIGYRTMVLDTLPQMRAAQHLYQSFGFRDIPAYYDNPTPGVRYLALDLG